MTEAGYRSYLLSFLINNAAFEVDVKKMRFISILLPVTSDFQNSKIRAELTLIYHNLKMLL